MSVYLTLKDWLTATTGFHIYRKNIPLGVDLNHDLRRFAPDFSPRTILDVGANIGQTAQRFAALWPAARIFSFEPVKQTFAVLQANTNKLPNVETFNIGLSDHQGNAQIFLSSLSALASLERSEFAEAFLSGQTQTVELDTLDHWCPNHAIERVDLLKIDAEGHDLKVLRGGATLFEQQRVGAALIETHLCGSGRKDYYDILEWFETHDFRLVAFHDQDAWVQRKTFCGNCLFLHASLMPIK